jgi:hypothetical protein
MAHQAPIPISDIHRRGISTALGLLDEMLCRFEEWARGRERHGVLFHELNPLSPAQRKAVRAEIEKMRRILRDLQALFDLEPQTRNVAQALWSESIAFWETLVETEAKPLRRYGPAPAGLAEVLDPRIERLIQGLVRLMDLAHGRPRPRSPGRPAGS